MPAQRPLQMPAGVIGRLVAVDGQSGLPQNLRRRPHPVEHHRIR